MSAIPVATFETTAVTRVTRGGATVLQSPTKAITKLALVGGGVTLLKLVAKGNEHHYISRY